MHKSRAQLPRVAAILCTLLGGCSATHAPIVDMTGVDQATYNRDLADCVKNQPAFAFGNPVTRCMKEKGYTILVGY
ncbi:hypothetical protein DLREEDagr8_25570 [Dongia sp. agr-C8]